MEKLELQNYLKQKLSGIYNDLAITNIGNYIISDYLSRKHILGFNTISEYLKDFDLKKITLLKKKVPIQYVLNTSCFFGLNLYVDQSVLIPRPETEELVSWIIKNNESGDQKMVIDIGAGSGCISIALKKHRPEWIIYGIDISEEAIEISRKNAKQLNLNINYFVCDFLHHKDTLKGPFDIIISNPPYVSQIEFDTIQIPELCDPIVALIPDSKDPLIFYKDIASWAKNNLRDSGEIYLELNEFRFLEIEEIFIAEGYTKTSIREDMQGKKRMLHVKF
jgi:release factor glutamine methyltransferase